MWAAKYIENTGHIPEDLHKKIADNIDELKGHFDDDVLASTRWSLAGFRSLEEKLSWMLFVDGCSLLYILEKADLNKPWHMNIRVDQLVLVMMDVLLLENQLPYQVLKLLWTDEDESGLIESMMNFVDGHHWATPDESQSKTPFHLLDRRRNIILITSTTKIKNNKAYKEKWSKKRSDEKLKMIYSNIKDLKALGIRLKSSKRRRPRDIDFSEGWFTAELTLPEIVVDNISAATFLNLIAYEMCPDFDNDYGICSFVSFMDSLIDHPEDVKEMRSKGISLNSLGSDEEVVELFNIISTDLVPNTETYFEVKDKMLDHYYKYRTWIVRGYYTYFRIAAFIALALTFIRTVFTIYPAFKKDG
ncbi:hypothetical protein MtrunA17_Chr7g0238181 [Medicago truncatula]|uniref:DUF247 domain protein n=1 Tax=Medicago truncatula TaxID=3880 RepID=A0A396H029_MEDTR|nr:uncharacterized protein LOC11405775 [Medicago truncatula]RHN46063.1 hypothetical protein MtrunA17_Chr7g0238181 [Medicago truncatula]